MTKDSAAYLSPDPVLDGSKLVADYFSDPSSLLDWYGRSPKSDGDLSELAESLVAANYPRDEAAQVLRRQQTAYTTDPTVDANIGRLTDGALAVITGQQVGLLTGPVYTIYKALTAIALADSLEKRLAHPVVPMFWMAADDHDIDEIDHVDIFDSDGRINTMSYRPAAAKTGTRTGHIRLDDKITSWRKEVWAALPNAEWTRQIADMINDAYRPGKTLAESFAALLSSLLIGRGLVIINPADSELKRLMLPAFMKELDEPSAFGVEMTARSQKLESDGYHAQVAVATGSTALFCDCDENIRRRVDILDSGLLRLNGTARLHLPQELARIAEETPDVLSPNALLRPVCQDTVFPTIAVVMGPAEIAYMGQAAPIYERHGVTMPMVIPRARFIVVDQSSARSLEVLGLQVHDAMKEPDRLFGEVVGRRTDGSCDPSFEELCQTITDGFGRLEERIAGDMPEMVDVIHSRMRTALAQVFRIEIKLRQVQRKRNGDLRVAAHRLAQYLYPKNGLQERVYNVVPFFAACGAEFIDRVAEAIDVDDWRQKILWL